MAPMQWFSHHHHHEDSEYGEGNRLLGDLQLTGGPAGLEADPVGWDREAIFEEGNRPTNQDDDSDRAVEIGTLQVPVPCGCHEYVGQ